MDLLHLVDRLEELIAGAQKMPIGNRAIVDRRRMLDLIDQMRVAVPQEVREAQEIVAHRDAIRREAEEEGRIIAAQAEERAARLTEQHEITQAARARAEEIAREAERRLEDRIDEANRDIHERIQESRRIARQQMDAADDYARELLQRLERQLQAFVNSVHSGIEQLEPTRDEITPASGAGDAWSSAEYARQEEPAPPPRVEEPPAREEPRSRAAQAAAPASTPASPPAQEPIPLRGREEEPAGSDDDLENLLRRDRAPAPPVTSRDVPEPEPGVIDDFEHEPLDDDPILRPRGSGAFGRDEERR